MHKSVMLPEVLKYLEIKPNGLYVDLTFGSGGHSHEILKHLNFYGRLFVFDKDYEAYIKAKKLSLMDNRINAFNSSFDDIYFIFNKIQLLNDIDGIIIDLGISLLQIKNFTKGFGFTNNNFLDMRLDTTNIIRTIDWINFANQMDLENLFSLFNDKSLAKFIAEKIISIRSCKLIKTTNDLCNIFFYLLDENNGKKILGKLFQFMRIFANNDFFLLKRFLKNFIKLLKPYGKLILISFNPLEEYFIKKFVYNLKKINILLIQPSFKEININLSSKSARMHVIKNVLTP